jgi:phage recombination protein Bet
VSNEVIQLRSNALAIPEEEALQVLQSSLYPGAALDSIRMVLSYCRAANLDPFQKPVHIVPMWDKNAGQMRDVIMPGVNLYRTQASRSGEFAGISEPEFGPILTQNIGGQDISFPEWCKVTVKRQLKSGHVAEFTAVEYWMENYAQKGGKDKSIAPNAMWTKRPRGQLAKCASAQALRSAFPEIAAQYTAEEMEGKEIHQAEPDILDSPNRLGLSAARFKVIRQAAGEALRKYLFDDEMGAYEEVCGFEDEVEKQALWRIIKEHSGLRASIKKMSLAEHSKQTAVDAQIVKEGDERQEAA